MSHRSSSHVGGLDTVSPSTIVVARGPAGHHILMYILYDHSNNSNSEGCWDTEVV